MYFNLDKKILLNQDTNIPFSIFSWSLQESNQKNDALANTLVPYPWSIYFNATNLCHNYSVNIEQNVEDTESCIASPILYAAQEKEVITAKLSPYKNGLLGSMTVLYSMFGTNRIIDQFELEIHKTDEISYREKGVALGCISYTSESEITDDTIILHLYLKPQRFEKIIRLIDNNSVDELLVRLCGVPGLYCEKPYLGVNNTSFKILTHDIEAQEVIMPPNCKIHPPRLGEIREFDVKITKQNKCILDEQNNKLTNNGCASDVDNTLEMQLRHSNFHPYSFNTFTLPLWLIFMALCVILLR